MSKPLSEEAIRLLRSAPRYLKSEYVAPALFDGSRPMPKHTYSAGWRRILERAGVPHCCTYAVRHRSATDIANSGVPVKVAMALTAHKTVTMFMRYVHTEDGPIRAATKAVSARRSSVIGGMPVPSVRADRVPAASTAPPKVVVEPLMSSRPVADPTNHTSESRTQAGNYRSYRNRKGSNRATPPKAARATVQEDAEHV